jgi:hypothetical protein
VHQIIETGYKFTAVGIIAMLVLAAAAAPGTAQSYTKLQVLLPGESAAPGAPSGKTGSPEAQTAGMPFTIKIRACDDSWNTVTSITHIVSISSTDESATLPGNAQLVGGEIELTVTFNAGGSFMVYAHD